jgi:hypothetical protein
MVVLLVLFCSPVTLRSSHRNNEPLHLYCVDFGGLAVVRPIGCRRRRAPTSNQCVPGHGGDLRVLINLPTRTDDPSRPVLPWDRTGIESPSCAISVPLQQKSNNAQMGLPCTVTSVGLYFGSSFDLHSGKRLRHPRAQTTARPGSNVGDP